MASWRRPNCQTALTEHGMEISMSHPPDQSDERSFGEALSALIERAHRKGVNVEGAWKCSVEDGDGPHWDIQITRVEYGQDD